MKSGENKDNKKKYSLFGSYNKGDKSLIANG